MVGLHRSVKSCLLVRMPMLWRADCIVRWRRIATVNETTKVLVLREIGLGTELTEGDQISLAELGSVISYPSGELIFREGEKHPFIYWVIEGRVSLEMASSSKGFQTLLTLGSGDLLAWSSLLTNRRTTAAAKCLQETRLLRFDTDRLVDLCERNHEIGYRVMEHLAGLLAQRLLATRLQMLDLFQHPREASE